MNKYWFKLLSIAVNFTVLPEITNIPPPHPLFPVPQDLKTCFSPIYNILINYLYILQNDHHSKSITTVTIIFLVMRTFKVSLTNMQIQYSILCKLKNQHNLRFHLPQRTWHTIYIHIGLIYCIYPLICFLTDLKFSNINSQ